PAPQLVGLHPVGDLVRGPAENSVVLPGGLVRRVVGQFILEEHGAAVLTVPDDVVLLVMLDEQAGRGDVVAVDDDAVAAGVDIPADRSWHAVVGAPGPEVVDQHVVTVDLEGHVSLANVRSTDPEVHIADRGGIFRVTPVVVALRLADLQEHRRVLRTGVDREAGQDDAGDVGHGHRYGAVDGGEGRLAETEHDRVRALDIDALPYVVHARREDEVTAEGELVVDLLDRVGRFDHEEVRQRDGTAGSQTLVPGDAARVRAGRRNADVVPAGGVD